MLSADERMARFNFYTNIFGSKRLSRLIFSNYLWPIQNYNEKIVGLTERGFKNPQKMITSLPAILGLSFDNIDRKLRLCRRLKIDVDAFIEYTIVFIGMSSKHYIPIARMCRETGKEPSPKNVFAIYKTRSF